MILGGGDVFGGGLDCGFVEEMSFGGFWWICGGVFGDDF